MSSVDVVVPCYNYGRFLKRCVDSILNQAEVSVRVLIIDDCSSDDTVQVGRALAAADARVEFRRHEVNRGHIATYNEGLLGWASAEFSMLLSADDALAPGALARATKLLQAHPDMGLAYGMALIVEDDFASTVASDLASSEDVQVLPGAKFLEFCCRSGNPVPAPTAVVRTKLQQKLGGYKSHLPHSADMELWMRFAVHGPVGIIRSVQAYYRWHGGNMSSLYFSRLLSDRAEQYQACHDVFAEYGPRVENSRTLLQIVSQRLGEEAFWLASKGFDEGDMEGSAACLRFAEARCVGLRRTGKWWRFRVKRFVGHGMWLRLMPLLARLRGVALQSEQLIQVPFEVGKLTGWWPGPARADR